MVTQKYRWDCGVCCLAMALGLTWKEARKLLPKPHRKGYFPGEIAKAAGVKIRRGTPQKESLERCILHVSLEKGRMAHHFIWSENGLHDPYPNPRIVKWEDIKAIESVIPIAKP